MFKNFKWFLKYSKKNYISGSLCLIALFNRKIDRYGILWNANQDTFIKMIVIAFVMVVLKYITAIGWSYNIFKSSSVMEYITRDKLMSKFLKQSQRFFEQNSTGSLMSKSTQDVSQVDMFTGFGILAFLVK